MGRLFGGDFSTRNNAIQLENSPLQRSGYAVTLGNVIVYGGGQATPQAYGPHERQHTIQGQWLVAVTDSTGVRVERGYDEIGRLVRIERVSTVSGETDGLVTRSFSYDDPDEGDYHEN